MRFEDLPGSMYGKARTAHTVEELVEALGDDGVRLLEFSKEIGQEVLDDPDNYFLGDKNNAQDVEEWNEQLELIRKYGALGWTAHPGSFFLIWRKADDPNQIYPWEVHAYIASGMGGYGETLLMREDGKWTAVEARGGKFE